MNERISQQDGFVFRDDRAAPGGNRVDFHLITHQVTSQGHVCGTLNLADSRNGELRAGVSDPADLDVGVTQIGLEDSRIVASRGDTIYRIISNDTLDPGATERSYPFVIERSR